MIIWAAADWPMVLALGLLDREVIDTGKPHSREALFIELPIFITVGAKPISRIIVAFIGESHGNPVFVKTPEFLDKPVIKFPVPFTRKKCDDRLGASEEFGTVPPA